MPGPPIWLENGVMRKSATRGQRRCDPDPGASRTPVLPHRAAYPVIDGAIRRGRFGLRATNAGAAVIVTVARGKLTHTARAGIGAAVTVAVGPGTACWTVTVTVGPGTFGPGAAALPVPPPKALRPRIKTMAAVVPAATDSAAPDRTVSAAKAEAAGAAWCVLPPGNTSSKRHPPLRVKRRRWSTMGRCVALDAVAVRP
jgi:hypothetical protein